MDDYVLEWQCYWCRCEITDPSKRWALTDTSWTPRTLCTDCPSIPVCVLLVDDDFYLRDYDGLLADKTEPPVFQDTLRLGGSPEHYGTWLQCAGVWTHNVVVRELWSTDQRLNMFNQRHQTVVCEVDPRSIDDWLRFKAMFLSSAKDL
jgi:hypothetical protein